MVPTTQPGHSAPTVHLHSHRALVSKLPAITIPASPILLPPATRKASRSIEHPAEVGGSDEKILGIRYNLPTFVSPTAPSPVTAHHRLGHRLHTNKYELQLIDANCQTTHT